MEKTHYAKSFIAFSLFIFLVSFFVAMPTHAFAAETWSSRTGVLPPAGTSSFLGVAWSPELGIFAAVPNVGMVATSPDGINWTGQSVPEANLWDGIAWSPSLHLFVSVAESGVHRVMTSPDGVVWTARDASINNLWTSVTWSPELNLFAAIAYGGTSGTYIMTSPDGTTWTTRTNPENNSWNTVTWSPTANGTGLFVAVAASGSNRVMTSPDGITWTSRSAAAAIAWSGVTWSADLSKFVAVGASGTTNGVMTSPDGITWTSQTSASTNSWYQVVWSHELSLFVSVAYTGTNRIMTSPDGVTWTEQTTPTALANQWFGLAWSPTLYMFVATGYSGGIMVSPDGVHWFAESMAGQGGTPIWNSVAWSPDLNLFAAVGSSSMVMTSPDGSNWTRQAAASNNLWRSVVWSHEQNEFVAVSTNGANRVMTSPDGITWTSRSAAEANPWISVTWAASIGKFVAVSSTGSHQVMISSDGITWTPETASGSITWQSVTWSPDLNLLVAVGLAGGVSEVMTSPDGVTWTGQTAANGNQWVSIAWSPALGLFAAVANNNGPTAVVMTSPDAVTWTAHDGTGSANIGWDSIVWSPERAEFVAVAVGGAAGVTNQLVMVSTDGSTWTAENAANQNSWNSIAWSPQLDTFVAVGTRGNYGAVMVSGPESPYNVAETPADTSVTITWDTDATSTSQVAYGLTSAYGTTTTLDATNVTSHSVSFSGLSTCTIYHFKAISTKSGFSLNSGDFTFTTTGNCAPFAVNPFVSAITAESATLRSVITLTGGPTPTVRGFRYGLTTGYGTTTTENGSFSAGSFTKDIVGLSCSTTYHIQAYATNSKGTGSSSLDMTFTTDICIVATTTTAAASPVASTTATLNASADTTGGSDITDRGFNYGITSLYGTSTTESGAFGRGSFSSAIGGLVCATTYHFQSYVTNGTGTATSTPDALFTTPACSVAGSGGGGALLIYVPVDEDKIGGYALQIGGGNTATLVLSAGNEVTGMALSNKPDISGASSISPFATKTTWDLCSNVASCSNSVYVRFYTSTGQFSKVHEYKVGTTVPDGTSVQTASTTTSQFIFTKSLFPGDRNSDVRELQRFLNTHNFSVTETGLGSLGNETLFFGRGTRQAVTAFQNAYAADILTPLGLTHGTGIFGPATLRFVNTLTMEGK